MASRSKKTITIDLDKLNLFFMAFTVVLAFFVGVLWQRVSDLESKGGGTPTAAAPAQPEPEASKIDDLPGLARGLGVDGDAFDTCVAEGRYNDLVEENYQGGIASGVTGTPGNIVINNKGEGWFVPGAVPVETLKAVVDAAFGNGGADVQGKMDAEQFAKIPPISDSDHILGDRNAQVYLIEYSDFQCPFCQRFHATAQQVNDEYSELSWVYRHFPLDTIHPKARPAALASECINELGGNEAFWKFTDEIFGA